MLKYLRVKLIIPLKTDSHKFFHQYVRIIQPLLGVHLSTGELKVLAELLAIDHSYKDLPEKTKEKLLLDYDNKIKVMDNLNINMQVLNNMLTKLRKKNLLIGSKLKQNLIVSPEKENIITFKLSVNDKVGTSQK